MSQVAALIEQFEHNLSEQLAIYRRIAQLNVAQGECLRRRDPAGVHDTLQQLEVAILERGKVEARRASLIGQAARILGVPGDEVSVEMLTRTAGIQSGSRLAQLSEDLKQALAELQSIVARNRASLEFELEVVDHLVKGMTEQRGHRPLYGRTGAHGEVPRLKILDAQV